eukprot:ANDGO_01181.mRNA.1 hypothetical protein
MIELQAGIRCKAIVKALQRLNVPQDAIPFYDVHAAVDPVHGADWIKKVVEPLASTNAGWGERILRGAALKLVTNRAFFEFASARIASMNNAINEC